MGDDPDGDDDAAAYNNTTNAARIRACILSLK